MTRNGWVAGVAVAWLFSGGIGWTAPVALHAKEAPAWQAILVAQDGEATAIYPDRRTLTEKQVTEYVSRAYQEARFFFDAVEQGESLERLRGRFASLRGFLLAWFEPNDGWASDLWAETADLSRLRRQMADPSVRLDVGVMEILLEAETKQAFLERVKGRYGPFAVEHFNAGTDWTKIDPQWTEEEFLGWRDGNRRFWYDNLRKTDISLDAVRALGESSTRSSVRVVQNALEQYRAAFGQYPASLKTLVEAGYATPDQIQAEAFAYQFDLIRNTHTLQMQPPSQEPWLGLQVRALTPPERIHIQGVKIEAVVPDGPAARAGFRKGDILAAVEGVPVATSLELSRVWSARALGTTVRVTGRRGADRLKFMVEVTSRSAEEGVAKRREP